MGIPGQPKLAPDDVLAAGAEELGVRLAPGQVGLFRLYREEILRWSERMNLTALTDPLEIVREGFLDSLACASLIPADALRALDVGSGAGFPGIPLAIVRAEMDFTLVEASRKKANFLKHVVRRLSLERVRIWCGRAEALSGEASARGSFDVALARAVAPLSQQAALLCPFLRPGGLFLAQVGAGDPRPGSLTRLEQAGYRLAGESPVPSWGGGAGHRIFALRWLGQPGRGCFT